MSDDKPQEPKQQTGKGLEIPVPKRKDVFEVFEKASKPLSDPRSGGSVKE